MKPNQAQAYLSLLIHSVIIAMLLGLGQVQAAENNAEQLRMLQQTAKDGDAAVQYRLAVAYEMGDASLGVKKNYPLAFFWYNKAAKQAHLEAQYNLARAYDYGIGVSSNNEYAIYWYRKAAEQGHTLAAGIVRHTAGDTVAQQAPPDVALDDSSAQTQTEPKTSLLTRADGLLQSLPPLGKHADTILDGEKLSSALGVTVGTGGKYWSWWFGAITMGLLTIGFWFVIRSPLGVSSSWDRVTHWSDDKQLDAAEKLMSEHQDQVQDAMLAAAIEEFGEDAVNQMNAQSAMPMAPMAKKVEQKRVPWQAHLAFLLMLLVGGFLSSVSINDFQIHWTLGEEYTRLFGTGWHTWALLIFGGTMIGFGTRMGGGCSSGHGLSGCSRLQPGSLLGTAAFFGTAIVVSVLVDTRMWLT